MNNEAEDSFIEETDEDDEDAVTTRDLWDSIILRTINRFKESTSK